MFPSSPSRHVVSTLMLAFCVGAIGWGLDQWVYFFIALLISGAIGLVWLKRIFLEPRLGWSLCDLQGGCFLAVYGSGGAISILFGDWDILGLNEPDILEELFFAFIFVSVTSGLLAFLAYFERPHWNWSVERIISEKPNINFIVVSLFVITLAIFLQLLFDERLKFRNRGQEGQTVVVLLLSYTMSMILGWLGWTVSQQRSIQTAIPTLFCLIFIPAIYIFLIGQGRLILLVHILIFFIFYLWGSERWLDYSKAFVFSLVAIPLFTIGAMSFEALRSFGPDTGLVGTVEVHALQYAEIAAGTLSQNWSLVADRQLDFLPVRVFFLDYLADLINTPFPPEYGYGRETLAQLVLAVPSVLLPDKTTIIESLGGVNEVRGVAFGVIAGEDRPNTILTAAAMEFGVFGAIYAPFCILFTGFIFSFLVRKMTCPNFRVMFFSIIILNFSFIESVYFTNSLICVIVLALFWPLGLVSGSLDRPSEMPRSVPLRPGDATSSPAQRLTGG